MKASPATATIAARARFLRVRNMSSSKRLGNPSRNPFAPHQPSHDGPSTKGFGRLERIGCKVPPPRGLGRSAWRILAAAGNPEALARLPRNLRWERPRVGCQRRLRVCMLATYILHDSTIIVVPRKRFSVRPLSGQVRRTRHDYIDRGSARGGCPISALGSGVWVEVDADVARRHLESFRDAARCQEWQESSPQFLRLVTARLICGTACHPRWFARLSLFPGACTAPVG